VILWGSDVARTVQHMQPALQRASKRGVPIIAIDIYRTDTMAAIERWSASNAGKAANGATPRESNPDATDDAIAAGASSNSRGYVIRSGADAALALALARIAFEMDSPIARFSRANASARKSSRRTCEPHLDLEEAACATGLAVSEIVELAQLLRHSRAPFIKCGVGWTRPSQRSDEHARGMLARRGARSRRSRSLRELRAFQLGRGCDHPPGSAAEERVRTIS